MLRFRTLTALAIAWVLGPTLGLAAEAEKPNVLFIAIDDLRDWIHYLGANEQVRTPNLDRLAARGVAFTRSYCAAPVCNPSRTALMSGQRPSTTGVYSNGIDWRQVVPDSSTTLNKHFMNHGYEVLGAGKIYHGGYPRDSEWTEYHHERNGDLKPGEGENGGVGGIRFAPVDGTDEEMTDYDTVSWTLEQLNKKHDKPLFMACGLHKPHMSWNVPRKYYDMYPLEAIQLPKTLDTDLDDVPPAGVRMARPEGDHADILKANRWKDAVQGYLAAITFCDAMIGRLLDGFDKSDYAKNTIVVMWCDHGWHLGEKQHWRKFALWEEATRAPLIFVVPGMTQPNSTCARTVDFMSLYPTLCDLCGLPTPLHCEGTSIRSLLADPNSAWDKPAITTHGFQNHAVRTEKWRYIRYADGGEELYDHENDPHEWTNLASKPELASVKSELAQWLPSTNVPEPKTEKGKATAANKGLKRAKKAAKKGSDASKPPIARETANSFDSD